MTPKHALAGYGHLAYGPSLVAVLISQLSVNSDSNLVVNIVSSVLPMISQICDENLGKNRLCAESLSVIKCVIMSSIKLSNRHL